MQRGVTVRVLLDHIASLRVRGYRRTKRRLKPMGADWHLLLPVQPFRGRYQRPDLRNHRKVLVVDGRVGFMGSQNMIDRTYDRWTNRRRGLRWKDLMVRARGADGRRAEHDLPHRLVLGDGRAARPRGPAVGRGRRRGAPRLPGRAERSRVRGREQPPPLQRPDLRRPAPDRARSARTSCPTTRCSTPSRRRRSAAWRSSCSSARSATRRSSSTRSAPTTRSC